MSDILLPLKVFLMGWHYANKNFDKIEDHHFFSYTTDTTKSKYYRKGVQYGRFYRLYRYEILAFYFTLLGIAVITIY